MIARRFAVARVMVVACGGATTPETGSTSPSAGGPAGGGGGAPTLSGCPPEIPMPGSPCGAKFLLCSFGDDPVSLCRPVASCSNGAWSQASVDSHCPTGRGSCPAALGACSSATVCTTDAGDACECTGVQPVLSWRCLMPPPPPCPPALPNEGATCDVPADTSCEYGVLCGYYLATAARCADGEWVWSHVPGCQ